MSKKTLVLVVLVAFIYAAFGADNTNANPSGSATTSSTGNAVKPAQQRSGDNFWQYGDYPPPAHHHGYGGPHVHRPSFVESRIGGRNYVEPAFYPEYIDPRIYEPRWALNATTVNYTPDSSAGVYPQKPKAQWQEPKPTPQKPKPQPQYDTHSADAQGQGSLATKNWTGGF